MDFLRHIWWVINHNPVIIGLWWFAMIIIAGVLITRMLNMLQKILIKFYSITVSDSQWNITLVQAVIWLAKVMTWIIIIAMIASRIGIPAGLIAAMGTIIGAALGFGSQETVRDVVKGSIHLLEKQFSVGDYIGLNVSGAEHEGVVKDVSLRTLTLATEENGVVTIPQGNITLIQNYSRNIGEFVVKLPFDTSTPVSPIIKLTEEVVEDIHTQEHSVVGKYITEDDIKDLTTITSATVRGVSSVEDGKIVIQVKGESIPGSQFAAKRALLKAIAGHLEENDVQFYSLHLPAKEEV